MKSENKKHNNEVDKNLIKLITNGNTEALNTLLTRYKDWIYNLALRMTGHIHDAEDITQEILLKIMTKLSTFKFKSSFKTWICRIAVNHVITLKRRVKEKIFSSFEQQKNILNSLPDSNLEGEFSVAKKVLVNETKTECMLGMLLCLSREQRIVFILGGIFGIESSTGAEILEISDVNFRKKLSRARNELKNFLENNCSLINKNNSCKCARKTKAAIDRGIINPEKLQYSDEHIKSVRESLKSSDLSVEDMIEYRHQEIFKDNPYKIFEMKNFDELMGNQIN